MDGTILVADDDRTIRTVLTQAFIRAGCKVHATASLTTLQRWVGEGLGNLVITDVVMPDGNGIKVLRDIAEIRPDLPVIVISAQNNIMTAIQAADAQAFDYFPKPFDLPDLLKRAARGLAQNSRLKQPVQAENDLNPDLPLVGQSDAMQALYRLIARVINAELAVLLTGESGTGKSLIARMIHDFSDRRSAPFVVVGNADFQSPDAAATLLAKAARGTLLIDEVGDLDGAAQATLVRLIDLIDGAPDQSGPRIIATSQSELSGQNADGAFRQDLYYRLSGVAITVPTLRDRIADIASLATHFLAKASPDHSAQRAFSSRAQNLLDRMTWPGNVRQLENLVRRLVVTSGEPTISLAELKAALGGDAAAPAADAASHTKLASSVAMHLQRYFDLHGDALPPAGVYQRVLHEIERPLIEQALEATGGNQGKCAALLGINRNTLHKKIIDLDIRVTRRRKLM